MKCSHCQGGHIAIRPTCTGVEMVCPECGHVYSPEEFRELLCRRHPRPAEPEPARRGPSAPKADEG